MEDQQQRPLTDKPRYVIVDWATEVKIAEQKKKSPEVEYEFSNGRKFYRKEKK